MLLHFARQATVKRVFHAVIKTSLSSLYVTLLPGRVGCSHKNVHNHFRTAARVHLMCVGSGAMEAITVTAEPGTAARWGQANSERLQSTEMCDSIASSPPQGGDEEGLQCHLLLHV